MIDAEALKKISIDKETWDRVKFGDVVSEPKESVKDLRAEGIEHVVGLEHIDSEDIHLRRSEGIEESTTFTKRFSKGDVLFGRRRAYLKKAARADFGGVCSGDITVMRAKEDLIPELLPFIVNNENFFDYAVTHSAGGLSPRVKFKDLANYELSLPSRAQQLELSKLFSASDFLLESHRSLRKSAKVFSAAQVNSAVLKGFGNSVEYSETIRGEVAKNWNTTTIGQLLKDGLLIEIQDGNHGEIHPKAGDYVEDGIPFVMANIFSNGVLDLSESKKLPKNITDKLRIGFSLPGDLLLTHKGTVGEVAIVPDQIEWPYLMLTPQVTYYRVNEEVLSTKFLYFLFTSNYFQQQLSRLSSQSTRAYVGITAQESLKVVIPPTKGEQDEIVDVLQASSLINGSIGEARIATKQFQNKLIEQVF
jgi:type I restriction enzyme, S subunit